jgi:hypothetical protein
MTEVAEEAPGFPQAYPWLREALETMAGLLCLTPEDWQAFWAGLSREELVHLFVILNEPRLFYENAIRGAINAEAQDRFLSQGIDMGPVLRDHVSEHPQMAALLREARQHTELRRDAPSWRAGLDRAVQAHEAAAAQREAEAERFQAMRDLHERMARTARQAVTGKYAVSTHQAAQWLATGMRADVLLRRVTQLTQQEEAARAVPATPVLPLVQPVEPDPDPEPVHG